MSMRIIDPDLVERCAFALFAVDFPTTAARAWQGMTETARHAYATRALAVLEEALRSPLATEPGEVSP